MPNNVVINAERPNALVGMTMLRHREFLHIKTSRGSVTGGNQMWYPIEWQRRAGCGPTTAALLFSYMAQTRPELANLCKYVSTTQEGFLMLMLDVWHHVKPGFRGLNKISMMVDGALSYAEMCGVPIKCDVMEVTALPANRPETSEMMAFLMGAMEDNLPVAFLNLSNGKLKNLDGWHWVTLVGVDPEKATALMFDQGRQVVIDLDLWIKTSIIGGGFVVFRPQ